MNDTSEIKQKTSDIYETILSDLKYFAETGLGAPSSYDADKIVELLQELHAENDVLRKMQPVTLSGDSATSFALALELSEIKAKLDELSKEKEFWEERWATKTDNQKKRITELRKQNDALQAYKKYMNEMYGQGYGVANWHLNGDLEPLDTFLEGAEAEYNAVIEKEEVDEQT